MYKIEMGRRNQKKKIKSKHMNLILSRCICVHVHGDGARSTTQKYKTLCKQSDIRSRNINAATDGKYCAE